MLIFILNVFEYAIAIVDIRYKLTHENSLFDILDFWKYPC